jgi:hypothetical protein
VERGEEFEGCAGSTPKVGRFQDFRGAVRAEKVTKSPGDLIGRRRRRCAVVLTGAHPGAVDLTGAIGG